MTVRQPSSPAHEPAALSTLLSSYGITLRDVRILQRGMIIAVQPLTIDGNEICTDTVLAELARYRSVDELKRETETLPLKKTTYGDFEASLTAIPKYCFTDYASHEAVLVHAVPKITLDAVLHWCEERYPQPYPYEPLQRYTAWMHLFAQRVRSVPGSGAFGIIRKAAAMPELVFPPPGHIGRRQRLHFAAALFRQVLTHHRRGLIHDCISEKTIFFPTAIQPKFLANYTGIPSATLADYLPETLLSDDAISRYGREVRDVYAMALIGYRIMTGEHLDGRTFSIGSPRPAAMLLRAITMKTRFQLSLRSFKAMLHSIVSTVRTLQALLLLIPGLFTQKQFTAWRRINRATGGIWRALPVVGPLCDILFPTPAARALRTVLDRSWFEQCLRQTEHDTGSAVNAGDAMKSLVAAFTMGMGSHAALFTEAYHALASEAQLRRQTFGTLMEGIARPVRSLRQAGWKLPVFTGTLLLILGAALVFTVRELQQPKNAEQVNPSSDLPVRLQPVEEIVSDLTDAAPPHESAAAAVSPALTSNSPVPSGNPENAPQAIPLHTPAETPPPAPREAVFIPAAHQGRTVEPQPPEQNVTAQPPVSPAVPETMVPPVPAPPGLLVKSDGDPEVYIVRKTAQPCNPAQLQPDAPQKNGSDITRLLKEDKLYLIRQSNRESDAVICIRKCSSADCDPSMYYVSLGISRIGTPVTVQSGDLISTSSYALRRYLRDQRRMGSFQQ